MPRAPVCPFYGHAKRERLVCLRDGAGADTGEDSALTLAFPDQASRARYWARHCCSDWKACSLAAALWVETNGAELIDRSVEICCGSGSEPVPYTPPKSAPWRTKQGLEKLESWARSGLTRTQIAEKCGCNDRTFRKWVHKYPDIAKALRGGGLEPIRKPQSEDYRTPEGLKKIEKWSRKGLRDADIARRCRVDWRALWKWRHAYPEIEDALMRGRSR